MTLDSHSEKLKKANELLQRKRAELCSLRQAEAPSTAEPPKARCSRCGAELHPLRAQWGCIYCSECNEIVAEEERQTRYLQIERLKEEESSRVAEALSTYDGQVASGIPPQYHGASPEDFGEFGGVLRRFAEGSMPMLSILGPPGVGKTRALYAVYRMALCRLLSCRMYRVPMLIRDMQAAMSRSVSSEVDMLKTLCAFDGILLLDELGAIKETDFSSSEIALLVSERELWGRPTAIASNLSVREIAEVSPRLADRIAGGIVHVMSGRSRRLKR